MLVLVAVIGIISLVVSSFTIFKSEKMEIYHDEEQVVDTWETKYQFDEVELSDDDNFITSMVGSMEIVIHKRPAYREEVTA